MVTTAPMPALARVEAVPLQRQRIPHMCGNAWLDVELARRIGVGIE